MMSRYGKGAHASTGGQAGVVVQCGLGQRVRRVCREAAAVGGPVSRTRLDRITRDVGVRAAGRVLLCRQPRTEQHGFVEHAGVDDHRKRQRRREVRQPQGQSDADQWGDVVPPVDAAPTPLIRLHGQRVVVGGGEAEHLLAAVVVPCRDDAPHLVRTSVATVDDVLERDARRHCIRPRQMARLLCAEVKDLLCLGVVRDNLGAEAEGAPLEVMADEVELGWVYAVDVKRHDPVGALQRDAPAWELFQLALGRVADPVNDCALGIEGDFDRLPCRPRLTEAARRLFVSGSPLGKREDTLSLVEQVFVGTLLTLPNRGDRDEIALSRDGHAVSPGLLG